LSGFTIIMLIFLMNTFCSIQIGEVASLFGLTSDTKTIYQAAQQYLVDEAYYSLRALTVVRYHLEAYNVLSALSKFACTFDGLGCLFGYSGINSQPLGGYGAHQAALNIFFSGALMANMTALNFLFILLFIYKGFVLLFVPLGIFLRSMPYLRTFGALLIAVALSFLIVYPMMLAIYYMMESVILDAPNFEPESLSEFYDEGVFASQGGTRQAVEAATCGDQCVVDNYFPNGDKGVAAMRFAAYAFIAGVFLPTAAMLATIGSIVYMTRLYGEEIDLSRIVQMV